MSDKQRLRELVWGRIEAAPEVRRAPGAVGRIPNYAGAEAAAERLAALPEWQRARVVKMNPDSPQLALRARAIEDGKVVYMAVPKLASDLPFVRVEKSRLTVPAIEAATIDGAARHGTPLSLGDMEPIDLIVCGSVAVNAAGVRIGKGGGYADIEHALLSELGRVTEQTLIATTVHDLQVLDEALPETPHDFRVDRIATPTRLFVCPPAPRPRGIRWEELPMLLSGALFTCMIGVFSVNNTIFDVWVMLFFGVVGYFMLRYGFPTAGASIAFVLGTGLEINLRSGLMLMQGDVIAFVTRPYVAVILCFSLALLVIAIRSTIKLGRKEKLARKLAVQRHLQSTGAAEGQPSG